VPGLRGLIRGKPFQVLIFSNSSYLFYAMDDTQNPSHHVMEVDDVRFNEHEKLKDKEIQDGLGNVDAPAMQILDPRGDLKLRNGKYSFLVSSNVLMLSSRYFKKMLQADAFEEGLIQPQAADPPTKILADADPISFGIMCKLLHFQHVVLPRDVQCLGAIADVCDYYGCERAISVHIRASIHPFEQADCRLTAPEVQKLLWVAFVFDLEYAFEVFSVRLAAMLDVDSVKALDLGIMPEKLQGESA